MMTYSLLDDPLIHVRKMDDTVVTLSLPQVFEALNENDVLAFEALQPHQQQAWYSFLVQLAAMAVARECDGDIPNDSSGWRTAILALADGNSAAWHLVVDDLSEPAFMQPPVPEGTLKAAKYESDISTPDRLDVLITSKNHDLKRNRINHPNPEYWLYALCTLQTMEGFLGRGNYGIVRMNGGFGNRPLIGLTHKLSWGARFQRDLRVLITERDSFSERYDLNGHALLWILSWDGSKDDAISINHCDPYFLEICRRIRFTQGEGTIQCWRTNSKGQRVDAPDDLNGRTGDPWVPIEKENAKALTLGESGFTYELIQQVLLGGEYDQPIALKFQADEREGAYFIARTLVRGQGKTDGLHHRVVFIPRKVTGRLFRDPSERDKLAKRAEQRISLAANVQRKILYPSIATLLKSGRDSQGKVDWEKVNPWTDAFDQAIDTRFFESLWASVELEEEKARAQWEYILWEEAQRQFRDAEGSTPIAAIHRWRARSKARSIFHGSARNVLEYVFDAENFDSNNQPKVAHESTA